MPGHLPGGRLARPYGPAAAEGWCGDDRFGCLPQASHDRSHRARGPELLQGPPLRRPRGRGVRSPHRRARADVPAVRIRPARCHRVAAWLDRDRHAQRYRAHAGLPHTATDLHGPSAVCARWSQAECRADDGLEQALRHWLEESPGLENEGGRRCGGDACDGSGLVRLRALPLSLRDRPLRFGLRAHAGGRGLHRRLQGRGRRLLGHFEEIRAEGPPSSADWLVGSLRSRGSSAVPFGDNADGCHSAVALQPARHAHRQQVGCLRAAQGAQGLEGEGSRQGCGDVLQDNLRADPCARAVRILRLADIVLFPLVHHLKRPRADDLSLLCLPWYEGQ
mmetsp:Transcript_74583/g.242196  ORF Transcript_74583/g.242196 Transcript_74583/m.242196 type:complete len:335 (-) Transcript_74583:517-1521(-)